MNKVGLDIIGKLADELELLREEVQAAKKVLEEKDKEIVSKSKNIEYWYQKWLALKELQDEAEKRSEVEENALTL